MSDIDPDVDAFVDMKWRTAMASARETMESLRDVVPELEAYLPEKSGSHFARALGAAQDSYRELHAAGALVLGEDGYREYLEAQTTRRIGG